MKKLLFLLLLSGASIFAMEIPTPPLIWVVQYGDLARMQALIACGVDINGRDTWGNTALHKAAGEGNLAKVTYLLDHGALVDGPNSYCHTPLFSAARYGHIAVAELLWQRGADLTIYALIVETVYGNQYEMAQWLIDHGVDVCEQRIIARAVGAFIPNEAFKETNRALIELFLDNGADVYEKDIDGRIALFQAAHNGREDVLALFIKRGFDIESRDSDNRTMLHIAVGAGRLGCVRELLAHGADIYAECDESGCDAETDKKTITPYMLAYRRQVQCPITFEIMDEHRRSKQSKIKGIPL